MTDLRIAVLTDIHGNAPALRAALHSLGRHGTMDAMYVLGDSVGIGPDSNEVLDLLLSRHGVTMLAGNHERDIVGIANGTRPFDPLDPSYPHHAWLLDRLRPDLIDALQNLPLAREVTAGTHSMLLTHYHLELDGSFLPLQQKPTAADLNARYLAHPAHAILFGHHHPTHWLHGRRLYLNPGSLGTGSRPVARFAVLEVTADDIRPRLYAAPYDRTRFLRDVLAMEMPSARYVIEVFHHVRPYTIVQGGADGWRPETTK